MTRITSLNDLTEAARATLRAQGYIAVVYAQYGYANKPAGTIISKHKSRGSLERAERRDTAGHYATMIL